MNALFGGSIDPNKRKGAITEFLTPFISESIWSEALADLFVRGGRKRRGSRVFNEDDVPGTKMSEGIKHLVEAQMLMMP